MPGIKSCIIWIVRYTGSSRDLLLKGGTLRVETEAGERFVGRVDHRPVATRSPPTVDIRWKVRRRQGWVQDQIQERFLGDGEFWQKHKLVPVLRRSHRRRVAISQARWKIRALWPAQGWVGGVGCLGQRRWWCRRKTGSACLGRRMRAFVDKRGCRAATVKIFDPSRE